MPKSPHTPNGRRATAPQVYSSMKEPLGPISLVNTLDLLARLKVASVDLYVFSYSSLQVLRELRSDTQVVFNPGTTVLDNGYYNSADFIVSAEYSVANFECVLLPSQKPIWFLLSLVSTPASQSRAMHQQPNKSSSYTPVPKLPMCL